MSIYNPHEIEPKWQSIWDSCKTFRTSTNLEELQQKPKCYVLDMFPYPSGAGLHIGHPKGYTATDVIARSKRMQGFNVLHPMGWDAFGLPAERAAMREDLHPAQITERNINNFRRQIKRLGFSYDWEREVSTTSPDYYKWTQWIFLKLYEKGLAYTADVSVNWCPALGTVLANEEVQDGKYIETGDPVERRFMRQWMLKITAYADRLLSDLDDLDWPDSLKKMQRDWIGKSKGAEVTFKIQGEEAEFVIFTTRPDTLFGVTYCVLAPEHPLVSKITSHENGSFVQEYLRLSSQKNDLQRTDLNKDKTGVFTGAYAINPCNGDLIPIWVSDYVLMSYGSGAIMAVPAHDERDHEFAQKYGIPIIQVISANTDVCVDTSAYLGDGSCINSDFLNGLSISLAKEKMIDWLETNNYGSGKVQYRLRDWLFSRQRYWGEPFPIAHLEDGSTVAVSSDQLPVELPAIDEYRPTDDGKPPLARSGDDWLMVTMPDGRIGLRETNTMPQWAGSCWYYLRFIDPLNTQQAWALDLEKYWMPVDVYVGGAEHAVLHLLYARFWHKVLYDCGLVSTKEPFQRLFNQGMVLGVSYQDENGKYYSPNDVEENNSQWFVKGSGKAVQSQVEKMSKSKLNGTSPDEVMDKYGADSLRLYELFIGPLSASTPWQTQGVEGVYRFLKRVWKLIIDEQTGELSSKLTDASGESERELWVLLHKTIRGVTEDIESIDKMNTCISKLMILVNKAAEVSTLPKIIVFSLLKLLSPFAPHVAEELWAKLGNSSILSSESWPVYDESLCIDKLVPIAIQVNGKFRSIFQSNASATDEEIKQVALSDEKIVRLIGEQTINRFIIVSGKLINIIVN